jgi:hypothetical protein
LKLSYGKGEKNMTEASTKWDKVWTALIGLVVIYLMPIIVEWIVGLLAGPGWAFNLKMLSYIVVPIFVIFYMWAPKGVWFINIQPETATPFTFAGKYVGFMIVSNKLTYQKDDKYKKKQLVPFGHRNALDGNIRFLPGAVRLFGGLVFFLWPIIDVHTWKFRWNRAKIAKSGMEDDFSEKEVNYVFLKRVGYTLTIPDIEDSEMTSFGVNIVIYAIVFNPYTAVIGTHDSLSATFKRIEAMVRLVGKQATLDEWKGKTEDMESHIKDALGEKRDGLVFDDIFKDFGYWVEIKVANIIPPETKRNAAAEKSAASDRAQIKIIEAEAEATATIKKADAEAYREKKVYEAVISFGDKGILIRALEAMEKSPTAASIITANVPGLQQLLSSVNMNASNLSPQDIQDLKDIIKNMKKP